MSYLPQFSGESSQARLILASQSRYKQEMLSRLRLPFEVVSPMIDETAAQGELVRHTTQRLALEKAQKIALQQPDSWVIGCDQAADVDGVALSKPEVREHAIVQLKRLSGKTIVFYTAVCVFKQSKHGLETSFVWLDQTLVQYRVLQESEILRYVEREPAFDCAGSAKSEGLGISLFEKIESQDPTALIGLPLIGLSKLLRQAGFDV
jgi:septum formation protein